MIPSGESSNRWGDKRPSRSPTRFRKEFLSSRDSGVRVPLRNRKSIGTVTDVESIDPASLKYSLKPIDGTVSDDPFLTPGLIELAHWIAGFYLASVEAVFRTMLPKPSRGEAEKRKTEKHVMLAVSKGDIDFEQFSGRFAKQGDVLRS